MLWRPFYLLPLFLNAHLIENYVFHAWTFPDWFYGLVLALFELLQKFALIFCIIWIKLIISRNHLEIIPRHNSLLPALILNGKIMLDDVAIMVLFEQWKHTDLRALLWVNTLHCRLCSDSVLAIAVRWLNCRLRCLCCETTFYLIARRHKWLNHSFFV